MKYIKTYNESFGFVGNDTVFQCKETISDLLLPLTDEGLDIKVDILDKSWSGIHEIESEIERMTKRSVKVRYSDSWIDEEYVDKLRRTKPSLIKIRFGHYAKTYNTDYNDPLINEVFETITGYCKQLGMVNIAVTDIETRGSEYEDEIGNGLIKIGQVYYFKDEIKPSCGYCKISEHESAGGNLAKTHKLIKKK